MSWRKAVEACEGGACLEIWSTPDSEYIGLRNSDLPSEVVWLDRDSEWLPFLETVRQDLLRHSVL